MEYSGRIAIIAKPNSPKTEILGFDAEKKAYRVNVKAPAQDNRANIELIKFFTKLSKKKVRVVTGLTSKQKVLAFE